MTHSHSVYVACPSLYLAHTDRDDCSWSHLAHSDINIQ